jgi:hypothetical protein
MGRYSSPTVMSRIGFGGSYSGNRLRKATQSRMALA